MSNDQKFRNIILGHLPPEDFALLEPHLKREELGEFQCEVQHR